MKDAHEGCFVPVKVVAAANSAQMRRESDLFKFYTIESLLGAVATCLLLAMVINRYQIACVCGHTQCKEKVPFK